MPTRILHKESLIPGKTSKLVLDAPEIARKGKPGHFIMLRMTPTGERIPLAIAILTPKMAPSPLPTNCSSPPMTAVTATRAL